ncbi:MAG: formate hydrogenlyase [Peptococcaceae bacterium]|nr:formate hydrogenlyase [Peptococcaceae bacterium]
MNNVIYILVQIVVILAVAPLVNGINRKVKALSQKRKGAPPWQMYFDLYKLLKKNAVVSDVSSWIFKAAPYIVFATALAGALLVPVSSKLAGSQIPGDFILLIYTLVLGRFFMMAAALDTGSTFGGMGSSREAMISSLIEPSILVSLFTLGLIARSFSLPEIMMSVQNNGIPLSNPVYIMVFLAMVIVLIAETCRIPVDDPSTHLELTMIHEAMILEYSGRHLAFMEYGAAVKQLIFMTLLVNIFLPTDQLINFSGLLAVLLSLILYVIKIIIVAIVIAMIEIKTVKLKLFSIPNLAALAFILAFIGVLQYFILGGGYA